MISKDREEKLKEYFKKAEEKNTHIFSEGFYEVGAIILTLSILGIKIEGVNADEREDEIT